MNKLFVKLIVWLHLLLLTPSHVVVQVDVLQLQALFFLKINQFISRVIYNPKILIQHSKIPLSVVDKFSSAIRRASRSLSRCASISRVLSSSLLLQNCYIKNKRKFLFFLLMSHKIYQGLRETIIHTDVLRVVPSVVFFPATLRLEHSFQSYIYSESM